MTLLWKKFREKFKSERDVAAIMIQGLRDEGWQVWQEVQGPYQLDSIADIMAIRDKLVWVVEVKKSMSLALIEQANQWKWRTHFVSVCVMDTKGESKGRRIASKILKDLGIGLFEIQPEYDEPYGRIRENIQPALNRNPSKTCIKYFRDLDPVLQDFAEAGGKGSGHWTPFADTVAQLQAYIIKNPDCTFREAMEAINHHYASHSTARSSISKWLDLGKVKGLKKVYKGRTLHLEIVPDEIDEKKLRMFKYLL